MNLLRLLTSPLPVPGSWYAIPLRLIVGFGFLQHGYAKLARGPEDFISLLHAMGLPSFFLLGWLTIIVELVGGLMILVGALIPLATVPMMIVLFVAIITVHLPNGFSSIKLQSFDAAGAHFGQPGYETDPWSSMPCAELRSKRFGCSCHRGRTAGENLLHDEEPLTWLVVASPGR
jgi:putative oxidoreductase